MTLPRMEAIAARWKIIPPLSVSVATVASALGIKFETPAAAKASDNLQELAETLGAAGITSGKPQWLTT